MNMAQLAFVVRDNAVHEWRTLAEIASDEGVDYEELNTACAKYLTAHDLFDIYKYERSRKSA